MDKSEPRMAMLKTLCMLCCTVATTFAPCLQGVAQGTATPKRLTSFCGFKAGEMKKNDKGVDKPTKAKTPFRKLREVRLSYSPKGNCRASSQLHSSKMPNRMRGGKNSIFAARILRRVASFFKGNGAAAMAEEHWRRVDGATAWTRSLFAEISLRN